MKDAAAGLFFFGFIMFVTTIYAVVLLVMAVGALAIVGAIIVSLVTLIPKLVIAAKEKRILAIVLMLFLLVAPTGAVALGIWASYYTGAYMVLGNIGDAVADNHDNIAVLVLAAIGGLAVIALNVISIGVYLWSFRWPHYAHDVTGADDLGEEMQRAFWLLVMLFVDALLVVSAIVGGIAGWAPTG